MAASAASWSGGSPATTRTPAARSARSAATRSTAGSGGIAPRASRACATSRGADTGGVRLDQGLLDEALRLRLEVPARSAAHISEIIRTRHGVRIAERTLADQFRRRGFTRGELLRDGRTFGRYEADAPNERWIGDVLVGPFVPHPRAPGSVRARLFLLVDDHSRLLVHGRWVGNETLRAGQEVLHAAILRQGPAGRAPCRQRIRVQRRRARPELRDPGHPAHPQPAVLPRRGGASRSVSTG